MAYGNPNQRTTAAEIIDTAGADSLSGVRHVSRTHKLNWTRMWKNDQGYTPEEMFAAAGTDGKKMYVDANDAIGFVNPRLPADDPDYITLGVPNGDAQYVDLGITDAFEYSFDEDGNVTLTRTPVVFALPVTGPVGATVTLTPTGDVGTPEQTKTIGEDGTATLNAIAATYTLTSILAGYTDTPVSVVVLRSASVVCGLTQEDQP